MELKRKAISSIKWTTLSTVVNYGLQFLLIVVLARFLSPKDFGLMALIVIVIDFSMYFIDMGLSNAIIYKQEVSEYQLSTVYWLNIGTGFIFTVIIIFCAPLIARFYSEPALSQLLLVVSCVFIIIPIGQVYKALLQKTLRFDVLSKIEIPARIVAFLSALVLAVYDYGVYALIWMFIITNTIMSAALIWYGRSIYRPKFHFKFKEVNEFLRFGYFQLAERVLNYFIYQFDALVIGKLLGTGALGLYSMSKNFTQRPSQVISPIVTKIMFPYMAQLQNEPVALKTAYLRTINYLLSISFPIYFTIIILAKPIVSIFLGEKWIEIVPLVQLLAIFQTIANIYSPIGSLLQARGRTDLGFYWNLGYSVFAFTGIYVGCQFGLFGVAYALIVLYVLMSVPFYKILIKKLLDVQLFEYHKAVTIPLGITFASFVIPYIVTVVVAETWVHIASVIVLGMPIYGFLSVRSNRIFINAIKQSL